MKPLLTVLLLLAPLPSLAAGPKPTGWYCWLGFTASGQQAFGCKRAESACKSDLKRMIDETEKWDVAPKGCAHVDQAAVLTRRDRETHKTETIVIQQLTDCESLRSILLSDGSSDHISKCKVER